ncbi:MAG: hypothetical protein U0744_13770 [Gemmataceae bacterium]
MSKKPGRKPQTFDINQLAAKITELATGEPVDPAQEETAAEKNPAAVELGRKGGLKGGKARATRLSPKQRSDAAKKAAEARWAKAKTESQSVE